MFEKKEPVGFYQKWLDYVPKNEAEVKMVRDAVIQMRQNAPIQNYLKNSKYR